MSMVHLRVNGKSEDLPLEGLGLGRYVSPNEVKTAVARYMEMPPGNLKDYVVELHPSGNVTVRPQAVFG